MEISGFQVNHNLNEEGLFCMIKNDERSGLRVIDISDHNQEGPNPFGVFLNNQKGKNKEQINAILYNYSCTPIMKRD